MTKSAKTATSKNLFDSNLLWLAKQTDNPIACLSMDNKIVFMNTPALELFSCQPDDVLNKSFSRLLKKQGLENNIPARDLSDMPEKIEITTEDEKSWMDLQWISYRLAGKSKKTSGVILIAHQLKQKIETEKLSKLSTKEESFNLKDLMQDTINLICPYAQKKNLALTFYYPSNVPEVVIGNQQRIYRVLLSLINNAIKYTNVGTVFVTLERVEHNQENIKLRFVVQDTGIGIPSDKQTNLFKKNIRSTTTREIDLNLYTIKQLIESMHGKIYVESAIGKGSTFSFFLPFELPQEVSSEEFVCREESPVYSTTPDPKHQIRILVVEDDVLCQNMVKQILTELHYNADIAPTAQDALKLLKNHYDVILMDIGLPDKDGMTLTRDLRTKLNLNIPTIAMTGYEWDKNQYVEMGFNGLLKKPVSREKLEHTLFRVLYK